MGDTPIELTRIVKTTLSGIKPRLEIDFHGVPESVWLEFDKRLDVHFPDLFSLYYDLYAVRYDFFFHLEDLLHRLACMWINRAEDLKKLDRQREADPNLVPIPACTGRGLLCGFVCREFARCSGQDTIF